MVNGLAGRIGDGGSSRALEVLRDALKCFEWMTHSRATLSNTEGIGGASAGHFGGHREGIGGHRGASGADGRQTGRHTFKRAMPQLLSKTYLGRFNGLR